MRKLRTAINPIVTLLIMCNIQKTPETQENVEKN